MADETDAIKDVNYLTIGIISEPVSYTRKHLLKRLFNIRILEKITSPSNPFDTHIAVLPFSHKQFEKMSSVRITKLLAKNVQLLQKNGAKAVLLSECLLRLCLAQGIDTGGFANSKGKNLFLSLMPLCIRQIAKNSGIDLFSSTVCIRDTKLDRISEYLMRELCFDTKKLYLCTQNTRAAERLCESFCDETGLWISVCSQPSLRFDILLDVDSCQIRIGRDLIVRGAELGFDFGGYDVCHTDAAALLRNPDLSHPGWVYSYEK